MSSELKNFQEVLHKSEKPVFAMVTATWCNPCKLIKPEFLAKSEKEKNNATFIIVDADESQEICMEYDVTSIPTILVFKNSDTKVVERFSGSNIDSFNKFIQKHISHPLEV